MRNTIIWDKGTNENIKCLFINTKNPPFYLITLLLIVISVWPVSVSFDIVSDFWKWAFIHSICIPNLTVLNGFNMFWKKIPNFKTRYLCCLNNFMLNQNSKCVCKQQTFISYARHSQCYTNGRHVKGAMFSHELLLLIKVIVHTDCCGYNKDGMWKLKNPLPKSVHYNLFSVYARIIITNLNILFISSW